MAPLASHPWLTFELDTGPASPRLWMWLAEAASKIEHVAGAPLPPTLADQLHTLYLAKGALATTAIEGNTLSEAQALAIVRDTLSLPPSQAYLEREIQNVVAVCNGILARLLSGEPAELTVDDVRAYNRQVLDGLPLDPSVRPGHLRQHEVRVGAYLAPPPDALPDLVRRYVRFLDGLRPPPGFENRPLAISLLRAVVGHLYLAWIHPFGDGNGRTSRLVEYHTLLAAGVPSNAAHLLSNHYNKTRTEYYRQLDAASRSGGRVLPFVEYALEGLVDGLREQIGVIREMQVGVLWRNYVHDQFPDVDTVATRRQRRLVLDLSDQSEPVPYAKLRYVSPRMAEAYAGKTDRTLRRDVNALRAMGLIRPTKGGWVARTETVRAFLPARRAVEE